MCLQPCFGFLRHLSRSIFPCKLLWNVRGFKIHEKTVIAHSRIPYVIISHVYIVHNLHVDQKCDFDMCQEHMVHQVNAVVQGSKIIRASVLVQCLNQVSKVWKVVCGGGQE